MFISFQYYTRKEEIWGQSFLCVLVHCILVKKKIENHNSVGAGAHKVGKAVSSRPNFDHHFPNILTVSKGNISKNFANKYRNKNMYLRVLLCILIYFHFA